MIRNMTKEQLQDSLEAGEIDLLVDARHREEFNKGHIPGAKSIPADDIEKSFALPENKDAFIVFYCGSPK